MSKTKRIILTTVMLLLATCWLYGQNIAPDSSLRLKIPRFLHAGPIVTPLPVFHQVQNLAGKTFGLKDLLTFAFKPVEKAWPASGDTLKWSKTENWLWKEIAADSSGSIALPGKADTPLLAYLATYLQVRRWTKATLTISSPQLLEIFLDGQSIGTKTEADKGDSVGAAPGKVSQEVKLTTGKHRLLIKCLRDPASRLNWQVAGEMRLPREFGSSEVTITTASAHFMTIAQVLDSPKAADASISPDGELAAIVIRQARSSGDEVEEWIELRRTRDGQLHQTYRGGMEVSGLQWAPTGQRFSYTTSREEKTTLWIVDLEQGTQTPLLTEVANFAGHVWSPDGSFIIYNGVDKASPETLGVKRLIETEDRWPGWRDRSFLYLVRIPSGTQMRLTSGKLGTDLHSISRDGQKLLFSSNSIDYQERPYSKTNLYSLNLATFALDSLWSGLWLQSAQWSPDGKKILLTGGPSMFGALGQNVPSGQIPNDYDIQAYLLDPGTGQAEALTREFAPSINTAIWPGVGAAIYFLATDRSCVHLYRYDLSKRQFQMLDTGLEVLEKVDFALSRPLAVCLGSSVSTPPKVTLLDLKNARYRDLADPAREEYRQVQFGAVKSWSFRNARDVEIDGYVYYPPDFDPNRKYPGIVYYYGGTTPVEREFEGRYPKNTWAAQGYIVYVMQPSGATGYGQAFSALHVNDWGKIVADEIIDGTRKFLAAHPFVDETNVGCIGASYGGFMTMLLMTRTDMFRTAVAHAGISSLASYWGEGYWGYLYSSVATANSFPWNRRDIYIEQSPLFSADRIKTPLLLLHGADDTNVPLGESTQLYTALKLLGREVEFIQVQDQDHLIMRYSRRKIWSQTILAWLDRWLKSQPQWWQELYPPK